jgi:hypothetical protein
MMTAKKGLRASNAAYWVFVISKSPVFDFGNRVQTVSVPELSATRKVKGCQAQARRYKGRRRGRQTAKLFDTAFGKVRGGASLTMLSLRQ